ncbi:MAG: hypothetical protein RLZZ458_2524, partial [Planctomycetota bacterium]
LYGRITEDNNGPARLCLHSSPQQIGNFLRCHAGEVLNKRAFCGCMKAKGQHVRWRKAFAGTLTDVGNELLAAGVSLKTIQARLGHQDFGSTANTYSHLLEGAQAEAVAKVDELMSRVKKRG